MVATVLLLLTQPDWYRRLWTAEWQEGKSVLACQAGYLEYHTPALVGVGVWTAGGLQVGLCVKLL